MSFLLNLFLVSYGFKFLTLYPGAQQTAMGGAFAGIADNSFACLYNPAGLGFQRDLDFSFEYNSIPWLATTRYWNFAGILPLNKGSSVGLFGSGISFTPDEFTTGLSFGYKLHKLLGAGINIKYLKSSFFWRGTGKSGALDIGLLAKYPFSLGKFGIGFAIQNVGPEMRFPKSGGKEKLPLNIRTGISYIITAKEFDINIQKEWFKGKEWLKDWATDQWRLVITYDINTILVAVYDTIKEKPWSSLGVEFRPIPFFAIRFGYFSDPRLFDYNSYFKFKRAGWTLGMGFDFKFFRLDISDDSAFYYTSYYYPYEPKRLRVSLSINIGEPIFPKKQGKKTYGNQM